MCGTQFEVSSDLCGSVNFKRLKRLLGPEAMEYLIHLWSMVAEQAPGGDLREWTSEDIIDAAGWYGDDGEFIDGMIISGFLIEGRNGYALPNLKEGPGRDLG